MGVADTKDGTNFLEKGGMGAVDTIFEKGGVLVMSLWDDHYANMLWLDSTYPVDGTCDQPGVCRGPCAITTGVPADVEKDLADATVVFSDIKYGHIGSTLQIILLLCEILSGFLFESWGKCFLVGGPYIRHT